MAKNNSRNTTPSPSSAGSTTSSKDVHATAIHHQPDSPSCTANFEHICAEALALPEDGIEPFKATPAVVCRNARTAIEALTPYRARLESQMNSEDWARAFNAAEIAEALFVAAGRRKAPSRASAEIRRVQKELQTLRTPALRIARGLAELGYLPIEEVERIEAGSGLIDMAGDGVALAHLFRTNAAVITGLHPFTEDRLARMEVLGTWILRNVRPKGVRSPAPKNTRERALCDRLWTLLSRAYTSLLRGAFHLWGKGYSEHIPSLRRYAAGARTPPTPAPRPAPAPAPEPAPQPA